MQSLELANRVDRPGFMLASDSVYFQNWARTLFLSITHHAPWAHVHFHLFDPLPEDLAWCYASTASVSWENTDPAYTDSKQDSVLYWAAARYMRVVDIYEHSTPVINLDVDSIMVKPLSQEQFMQDLAHSWVPTTPPGKRKTLSLCSAIGFAADNTRYTLRDRLMGVYQNDRLSWALDQNICDELLARGQIQAMDLRYTDFKFKDDSYIWTGKGERVYKNTFKDAQQPYLAQLGTKLSI